MELETIGKYKVLGKIGQGSMGVVFKAHDPILNRFVAVKTMSESLDADSEARKRFLREAQSAARLNHPNIVTVYDLGEEQGRVYLAMELLEGQDLRHLIGTPVLAPIEEKLRVMAAMAEPMRPAMRMAIITGASSLQIERPTSPPMALESPRSVSTGPVCSAMTPPMKRERTHAMSRLALPIS